MSSMEEKLDQALSDLKQIKNYLKIVPDKDSKITDMKSSVSEYENFANTELKIDEGTITNHLSAISKFLVHSKGTITKETVKQYLESNNSGSWKSNQVKALRKYIRDYLKLGNWIEEFKFSKPKAKIKEIPSDDELTQFCSLLSYPVQMIFLVLQSSGLRIGEVLSLKASNVNFDDNSIDASEIHEGTTKSSWVSFITVQTAEFLASYMDDLDEDQEIFSISQRSVQQEFKNVSDKLGLSLNPHLLRTVFAEKCTAAGIKEKHINAFCGRVSQGTLAKNYSDYSPKSLRKQYDVAEPYLTLDQISTQSN